MRDTHMEAIAKLVYEGMTWAHSKPGAPPAWTEGGNSDAQEQARHLAARIMSVAAEEPNERFLLLNGPTYTHRTRGGRYRIVESFHAGINPEDLVTGIADNALVRVVELHGRMYLTAQPKLSKNLRVRVRATLQTSKPVVKEGWWVWYRAEDGRDWLRTPDEFFDGRFTVE